MSDKPPSRERYEEENPTVSFRISREKKETLDELVENLGVTKKDWFESIIEDEATEFDDVRETAYDEGYEDGRADFQIKVPCAVCGERVILRQEHNDEVYRILERLSRNGPFSAKPPTGHPIEWTYGHEDCVENI
jgi:hypothetical protein